MRDEDDVPVRVVDPDDCTKTIVVAKGPCVATDENGKELAWLVKGQPQYVIVGGN